MPTILCDHNVEGQVAVLVSVWTSSEWLELWLAFGCAVETLASLAIPESTLDSELWKLCQSRGIVLITANRNSEGEDSLEVTMRRLCQADSLPVVTIADADRVMIDRGYAEKVAIQIFEVLLEIDRLRGTRRLFVP